MATATDTRLFGKSIKRREDPRFITGRGNYTDDLKLPGMTYAAFVRSPHAHAKIRKIDVAKAKAHPGVVAAVTSAAVVVKKRIVNQRLVANAMEPRACVARFDAATGDLTLWVTSQNPHVHRLLMTAFVLGIPEHKVRVIAPDVGGGFGSKIFLYNEEVVCSWATRQIKRPVRWTATRREAYLTDAHGRDHVTEAAMAMSKDGKILGLHVKTTANLGAYLSTFGPAVPTFLYGTLLNGVYVMGAIKCEVTGVFTNTTAVDAYRGAGRPEACYVLERMIDAAAAALKMDPAEVRRKNFIPKFSGA